MNPTIAAVLDTIAQLTEGRSARDQPKQPPAKKKRWPTVRDTIVVLAGGRHCCIWLGGVGFALSNEDLAFRNGVCHLMNLFCADHVQAKAGPGPILGIFLATEQEEFF